ncbi:2Fe-2S iron-sulfur cluster-binding protein [Pseudonocardia hispaniensis]|uniref:2Fe-2S iron-sulfur cluster-binding protein n=1 Tax=Pseudonocardia hispaniensis TaxID=904933 RepID=A0ABW1IX80_9PSEU
MPKIFFNIAMSEVRSVDAAEGISLMEAAIRSHIPGIIAECGGACSCATCHVYIGESFRAVVGEPDDFEAEMLEEVFAERRPSSRLACQIRLTTAMDGLEVTVPVADR